MRFKSTTIKDCYIIFPKIHRDIRGSFSRHYCKKEFESKFLFNFKQANVSENKKKGTLRGFHYQDLKKPESKIISCIKGSIYNVVLDLRKDSKTFKKHFVIKLNDKNKNILFVPGGCANAFLTLEDNTFVHYYMNAYYKAGTYKGIRYNDPQFKISWPFKPKVINRTDKNFKFFK
jgi:dTDP-4-dehydrorhamnose 3,5-epimerase